MRYAATLLPLFLLGACDSARGAPAPVAVSDAWCRAAPAGALTGGCYLTLAAAADDRLLAIETPAAARVEIHAMDMTGGVMRMRKLDDGLPLPKGQAVKFAPGGLHVMLIGPKAALAAGGSVPLRLRFSKAPAQTVAAAVR